MAMHQLSQIAAPSTLDLFSTPPTQYAIQSNLVTEHRPIATITSDSTLTFLIHTPVDEYIQLKDAMLRMKIRVNLVKADGSTPASSDWAYVSPVNYLLHSMFKQIDIEINGKQISMAPQTYPFKAIFETIVGYTEDAKTSHLTAALYRADSTTNPEVIDTARNAYINPNAATRTGKVLDLMGKLHLDFAFQERAILGGSTIKITLVPHSPEFYLRADTTKVTPTVQFLDASLFIHRSKVSTSIVEAHELALKKGTAKYPICRNEVKSFTINTGTLSANIDNVVQGQIPRRAFVALIGNDAFNGSFAKNPYNFQHMDLNFIAMYIDGIQYPSIPYTPDFDNNITTREFSGLFEAVNQLTTDAVIKIDRDTYGKGNTIYGFNLSPDLSNSCVQEGHANLIKRGSMGVQLRFKKALTETINVLMYLEFDNLIEIDKNRQTITDYI